MQEEEEDDDDDDGEKRRKKEDRDSSVAKIFLFVFCSAKHCVGSLFLVCNGKSHMEVMWCTYRILYSSQIHH